MKKVSLLLSLVLVLTLVFSGCSSSPSSDATPTPTVSSGSESPDATQESTDSGDENLDGKEEIELTSDIESMLPLMDSLLLCMVENDLTYDPSSPEFVYTALHYAVGLYGGMHSQLEIAADGGAFCLPRSAVQEYAAAMFAGNTDLDLDYLAQNTVNGVSFDESTDKFTFMLGDRAWNGSRILSCFALTDTQDALYEVTVGLFDGENGEQIATGTFLLSENPALADIADPLFQYAITSAVIDG